MKISDDNNLTAHEVTELRKASGWDYNIQEWESCLQQNILNVSARDKNNKVIGIGFLCGNQRHAELVDLVVHPNYRNHGIGRDIAKLIVHYALEHKIKYFGLTYDKSAPWLASFYKSEGFEAIDFAMWHKSSLS